MAKISRSAFISMLGGTGVFLLTGCGSGTKKNSNYGGVYRSAYSIPSLGENGYFNFTVDVKGQLKGSFNDQAGKVREFTGELKNNGEFNGTTTNSTTGTTGYVSGKMASVGGTAIGTATAVTGGDFSIAENSQTYLGSFDVDGTPAPVATPTPVAANTFASAYRGTYYLPERNESGAVSFTVDPSGQMLGFFSQNANEPVGLFQGTISNSGNFTGTLTFNAVTAAKYQQRTLTGTIATATSSNNRKVADFVQTVAVDAGGTQQLPGNMDLEITSSEPNTEFRGSFSSNVGTNTFFLTAGGTPPAGTIPQGQFYLTVDKQGSGIGSVSARDGSSSIWRITISNDGRFSGTINGFAATGKLSIQQVPYKVDSTSGEITPSQGIFGTAEITVDGTVYVGIFFGAGGFQSGT